MKQNKFLNFVKRPWFVISILVIAGLIFSLFIPWNIGSFASHSNPAQSYEEAVQRINAFDGERASAMNTDCLTQFMTHGQKTDKAIVFVHGYTNCPKEFIGLGKEFYNLGYNVLIAPLPHHGLVDRLNVEQGQLSAEELASYTDKVVDIAQGLGDDVAILGLSGGGVVTAWAAQNRSDIDSAVVISPAFGFKLIPTAFTAPAMNQVLIVPDVFVWWDPEKKEQDGDYYTYPQYSKHALAQIMRFGFSVQVDARHTPPAAGRIIFVTNANDDSVNNELALKVAKNWQYQGAQIGFYEFPAELGLPHDLIDSNKPDENTKLVNQKIIELVTH